MLALACTTALTLGFSSSQLTLLVAQTVLHCASDPILLAGNFASSYEVRSLFRSVVPISSDHVYLGSLLVNPCIVDLSSAKSSRPSIPEHHLYSELDHEFVKDLQWQLHSGHGKQN